MTPLEGRTKSNLTQDSLLTVVHTSRTCTDIIPSKCMTLKREYFYKLRCNDVNTIKADTIVTWDNWNNAQQYAYAIAGFHLRFQQHFSNLVSATADSTAQGGLGIRSSFTKPSLSRYCICPNVVRNNYRSIWRDCLYCFWVWTQFYVLVKQAGIDHLKWY